MELEMRTTRRCTTVVHQLDLVNDLVMGTQLSISTGERVTDFLTHRGNRMIPLEVCARVSSQPWVG
jgi:hypothetical protein